MTNPPCPAAHRRPCSGLFSCRVRVLLGHPDQGGGVHVVDRRSVPCCRRARVRGQAAHRRPCSGLFSCRVRVLLGHPDQGGGVHVVDRRSVPCCRRAGVRV